MRELQSRVEETKRKVFLQRILVLSGASGTRVVASGGVGQELGLPYEQTLDIVGELERRGWIRSGEEMMPPEGPMVRLTQEGMHAARRPAA